MSRRTFFSFHYQPDAWRAWNVRNSWVVRPEDQQSSGFFDGSVFEATKREGPEQLKAFITRGLDNTSVTCVLSGQNTWERRWVRYEIVRSLLKGNGLLTVDIHNVKDNDQKVSLPGMDPLSKIGLYLSNGSIYFAENTDGTWIKYSDYTKPVEPNSLWMPAPKSTQVVPLSNYCRRYDFVVGNGRSEIGGWIEQAAAVAGH